MKPANWLPFLGIIFIAGILFRIPAFIYVPPAIAFLLLVSHYWNKSALQDVIYRRKWVYRKGFIGETLPVTVEVENKKPLPLLWLRILDEWPKAIAPKEDDSLTLTHKPDVGFLSNLVNLRWFSKSQHSYTLHLRSRGYYQIGPAVGSSSDLFSLAESEQTLAPAETVVVYPSLTEQNPLTHKTINPLGEQRAERKLLEDPNLPYGIRDYQTGDEFKRIHWNATARVGSLQTRLYQPVTSKVLMICLNVSTSEMIYGGFYPEVFEHLVRLSASLAYQSIQDRYAVGLLSNGGMIGGGKPFHIPPARSTHHLIKLLESLAGLQALTIARFENYLLHEMHSIPYGASLVVVTSILPMSLQVMLSRLQKYHHKVTLIYTGAQAVADLPGVRSYHVPGTVSGQGVVQ